MQTGEPTPIQLHKQNLPLGLCLVVSDAGQASSWSCRNSRTTERARRALAAPDLPELVNGVRTGGLQEIGGDRSSSGSVPPFSRASIRLISRNVQRRGPALHAFAEAAAADGERVVVSRFYTGTGESGTGRQQPQPSPQTRQRSDMIDLSCVPRRRATSSLLVQ